MTKFNFNPQTHQKKLLPLLNQLISVEKLTPKIYHQILRKYSKTKANLFAKSEVIAGLRAFYPKKALKFIAKIQMKPIRTSSGVVPVTLLTKPYPCPGKCIYCPDDIRMPKSYLSAEPGAQRAAKNRFDPYNQVHSRLATYYANGHSTDKIELIVLGGTWSVYPIKYKIWFIKRCFDALNTFIPSKKIKLAKHQISGSANWNQLKKAQLKNETAKTRCVGLSLETRPDYITQSQIIELRKLGCTKVQIGIQSLDDKVLKLNQRGHTTKEAKKAFELLRSAGFKIQAHWMANLYGSNPKKDIKDFKKLFSQKFYKPDELKIYPCSLLATAELMDYYKKGLWHPYSQAELQQVLIAILPFTPQYCRVNRIIRDFSADDIITGSKTSNFRQIIEEKLQKQNQTIKEIRSREIRRQTVVLKDLNLKILTYSTVNTTEKFLQFITKDNKIAGFLRLSLPQNKSFIKELANSAIIREIHIYGQALDVGEQAKTQHLGLGTRLINKAKQISQAKKYQQLSVISAIGTKEYYRNRGFSDGQYYQHFKVD